VCVVAPGTVVPTVDGGGGGGGGSGGGGAPYWWCARLNIFGLDDGTYTIRS